MPMNKPHLEFHPLDMVNGWQSPPGYPPGAAVQEKILASDIDEVNKSGSRTRLLRFEARPPLPRAASGSRSTCGTTLWSRLRPI